MKQWAADQIAAERKQPLPVVSFPAVQPLGITVAELIGDSGRQAEAMVLVAERLPTAASVSFMDLSVEAEAFGSEVRVTDDEVPTVVGAVVDEDTDPAELAVPEVGAGRTGLYVEAVREAASRIGDRPVLAGVIGPFSLAGRLMDVNEVMVLCYEEPELVHAVLEKCTEFIRAYAGAFKEAGADGVVMAEPLAGLLSPELMAEFSTPYARRIVDAVQDGEFAVVYHNCGPSVSKAPEAVAAVGAMGYHFGNASDMAEMLGLMPPDVLVMGNVDPAGQIRNGTPESVREATLALMESCSKYPNFVPSTGCDVPPMSPWENIDAFFAAVDEFYDAR